MELDFEQNPNTVESTDMNEIKTASTIGVGTDDWKKSRIDLTINILKQLIIFFEAKRTGSISVYGLASEGAWMAQQWQLIGLLGAVDQEFFDIGLKLDAITNNIACQATAPYSNGQKDEEWIRSILDLCERRLKRHVEDFGVLMAFFDEVDCLNLENPRALERLRTKAREVQATLFGWSSDDLDAPSDAEGVDRTDPANLDVNI